MPSTTSFLVTTPEPVNRSSGLGWPRRFSRRRRICDSGTSQQRELAARRGHQRVAVACHFAPAELARGPQRESVLLLSGQELGAVDGEERIALVTCRPTKSTKMRSTKPGDLHVHVTDPRLVDRDPPRRAPRARRPARVRRARVFRPMSCWRAGSMATVASPSGSSPAAACCACSSVAGSIFTSVMPQIGQLPG